MIIRCTNWFNNSAAVLLLLVCLIKLFSLFQDGIAWWKTDEIFAFLTQRELMIVAILLEAFVVGILMCAESTILKAWSVATLSSLFLSYRVSHFVFGGSTSCRCLGSLGQWLGIPEASMTLLSLAVLLFLISGSYIIILRVGSTSDYEAANESGR
jgi:hypothetical protein